MLVDSKHLKVKANLEYILSSFLRGIITYDPSSENVTQISKSRNVFFDILIKKYSINLPNIAEMNSLIKSYIEKTFNVAYLQHSTGFTCDTATGSKKYIFKKVYKGIMIKKP